MAAGLLLVVVGLGTFFAVQRTSSGSAAGNGAHATTTRPPSHGGTSSHPGTTARPGTTSRHGATSTSTTVAGPAGPVGPYGVESKAIIAENRKPGTSSWQITGTPPNGSIQGFANLNYASVGQDVGLYVSTTAPRFRVVAYRMGWYGGKGARQVWASGEIKGTVQPPCPVTPQVNMVSCDNWSRSLVMPVTKDFVQGDYLLKLVGSDNSQSYVMLTVWDPNSHAAYLFVNRSLTEQGWNTFGGYSYYQGAGPCTLGQTGSYPPCNRARVVSFDRPYSDGNGSSDFLQSEFPLLEFMEQHGLDVAYVTDITLNDHPSIVLQHRAWLSLDHDETWTWPELQAAQNGVGHGVNLAFFGAAALVRHARLQASPLGPSREEVNYRDSSEDPLNGSGDTMDVTGNTWDAPPTNWSSSSLVGGIYAGYTYPGVGPLPFTVYDASAWIFRHTGLQNGSTVPNVIDSDIDHLDLSSPTPPNIQVMGHSPLPLSAVYTNQGSWNGETYSDMTYYTTSGGAGVFDSGTVNWIFAMAPCPATVSSCPSGVVSTMTGNLLSLFGQGPAAKSTPSEPNAQGVAPAGS